MALNNRITETVLACALIALTQRMALAEEEVTPLAPAVPAATVPMMVNTPIAYPDQNVYLGKRPPRPVFYHWNGPWGPGCYYAPRGFHHSHGRPAWPF
jgi:hypothetical protein